MLDEEQPRTAAAWSAHAAHCAALHRHSEHGNTPSLLLLGDSLTTGWTQVRRGRISLRMRFGSAALACGTPGDAARHLLWRVRHGLTSGAVPHACVVTIGTNDLAWHESPARLWPAVAGILVHLRTAWPSTAVILTSIPPASWSGVEQPMRRINDANARLASIASAAGAGWLDITPALVGPDGQLGPHLTTDGVHLTRRGYARWAEALAPERGELHPTLR